MIPTNKRQEKFAELWSEQEKIRKEQKSHSERSAAFVSGKIESFRAIALSVFTKCVPSWRTFSAEEKGKLLGGFDWILRTLRFREFSAAFVIFDVISYKNVAPKDLNARYEWVPTGEDVKLAYELFSLSDRDFAKEVRQQVARYKKGVALREEALREKEVADAKAKLKASEKALLEAQKRLEELQS